MKVFLDDDRNHPEEGWVHVRSVPALMRLIDRHGPEIEHISFDNDLRRPEEGWMAVRDLVEAKQDDPGLLPALRVVTVHSANGGIDGAAANMLGRMRNAVRAGLWDLEVLHRPATSHRYPLAAGDPRAVDVRD